MRDTDILEESIDDGIEQALVRKLMKIAPGVDLVAAAKFIKDVRSTARTAAPARVAQSRLAKEIPDAGERRSAGALRGVVSDLGQEAPSVERPAREPRVPREPAPRKDRESYKIYGKKGGQPVHTRLKGRAYTPTGETGFKPGDSAKLARGDGDTLAVSTMGGDRTQVWSGYDEGEREKKNESLSRLLSAYVTEALNDE